MYALSSSVEGVARQLFCESSRQLFCGSSHGHARLCAVGTCSGASPLHLREANKPQICRARCLTLPRRIRDALHALLQGSLKAKHGQKHVKRSPGSSFASHCAMWFIGKSCTECASPRCYCNSVGATCLRSPSLQYCLPTGDLRTATDGGGMPGGEMSEAQRPHGRAAQLVPRIPRPCRRGHRTSARP